MAKSKPYRKWIYWIREDEVRPLQEEMRSLHVKLKFAKGAVCTPLDAINRISVVAPGVWNAICDRQGSWYRASKKNGRFLIVSSFQLNRFQDQMGAIVSLSDFKPPRFATKKDKQEMINAPEFKKKIPIEWPKMSEEDRKRMLHWARKINPKIEDDCDLYATHTANHANFIKPRFYVREADTIIPYSIDRSPFLCSCCLELYQVLGDEWTKKYVAPCAGAVLFARLKPDQYLLVEGFKK